MLRLSLFHFQNFFYKKMLFWLFCVLKMVSRFTYNFNILPSSGYSGTSSGGSGPITGDPVVAEGVEGAVNNPVVLKAVVDWWSVELVMSVLTVDNKNMVVGDCSVVVAAGGRSVDTPDVEVCGCSVET